MVSLVMTLMPWPEYFQRPAQNHLLIALVFDINAGYDQKNNITEDHRN